MKPRINIHYGAGVHTATIDGHKFDLNRMTSGERTHLRKIVVGVLTKIGALA